MFRGEFERRGLAPQVLSRAVEDSGTVTSVARAVEHVRRLHLGRARRRRPPSYLPYCFFNLLSPILDVVYGFLGFKVPSLPDEPLPDAPALAPVVVA